MDGTVVPLLGSGSVTKLRSGSVRKPPFSAATLTYVWSGPDKGRVCEESLDSIAARVTACWLMPRCCKSPVWSGLDVWGFFSNEISQDMQTVDSL